MRRFWKSVRGRGRQERQTSCLAGQFLQKNLLLREINESGTDTLASMSCSCPSTRSSVASDVTTMVHVFVRSVESSCASSPSDVPPFSQRRIYSTLENREYFVSQESVKKSKFRIDVGRGIRSFVGLTRNSGGIVSPSRQFPSGGNLYHVVRFFHARYATAAAAIERDYIIAGTRVSEGVNIETSLSSAELVDGTEPLTALNVELTEKDGALSHVAELETKLRCLRDWGLTDEELAKLRRHVPTSVRSALLNNSAKKLIEVAAFLVEECGVKKLNVADALLGNVFLASSRIEDCLRPKVYFSLLNHRATFAATVRDEEHASEALYLLSLGITKEQVGKIIDRHPQILTYNMEQRVLPMHRKLIECGLKIEGIGKAVMKFPGLFGTGINKIDRTIEFLKAAGVVEIAKCISRHPQILSLSLDGKVHNMTAFLKSELLLEPEIINKTIAIQPCIFTHSVEHNVRPKVMYFLRLGLERREVGRMIAVYPALIGHSLETSIKPKIDFLLNVMNRSVNEIVSFPQYLSYSLPCRIQPRYEYLANRGRNDISLSSMLTCRLDIFNKRYSSGFDLSSC